jgi:hypothetical protein
MIRALPGSTALNRRRPVRRAPASGIHEAMVFPFRSQVLFCAALLAPGAAGCSRSYTWVGAVPETDALAAIAVDDGALRAYVCGGPLTYATLTRWYEGQVEGQGSFNVTSGEWTMTGGVSDTNAFANFFDGSSQALFLEAEMVDDGLSGLYSVEDSGCHTGVIVMDNGAGAPILQGTWCDEQGHRAQVTPVAPIELVDGAIHVQVDLSPFGQGGGIRDLFVTRVSGR